MQIIKILFNCLLFCNFNFFQNASFQHVSSNEIKKHYDMLKDQESDTSDKEFLSKYILKSKLNNRQYEKNELHSTAKRDKLLDSSKQPQPRKGKDLPIETIHYNDMDSRDFSDLLNSDLEARISNTISESETKRTKAKNDERNSFVDSLKHPQPRHEQDEDYLFAKNYINNDKLAKEAVLEKTGLGNLPKDSKNNRKEATGIDYDYPFIKDQGKTSRRILDHGDHLKNRKEATGIDYDYPFHRILDYGDYLDRNRGSVPSSDNAKIPCGFPKYKPDLFSSRIVNGTVATKHSWPWVGALKRADGSFFCGLTLISPSYVLTAAHCVYNGEKRMQAKDLEVYLGVSNLNDNSFKHQFLIQKIKVHDKYSPAARDYQNDLALLKLTTTVNYNDKIRPVCLTATDVYAEKMCVTNGFGFTLGTGDSGILNEIPVPIVKESTCKKWLLPSWITENNFCAGYKNGIRDACNGDSGGGLVCKKDDNLWYLFGITSWGIGCAEPKQPGVYTKVSHFIDWITVNSN